MSSALSAAVAQASRPAGSGVAAVEIVPMRRRHLRGVLRIEQQVYPRPWSGPMFVSELGQGDDRDYLVARIGHRTVGYAGAMYVLPDAHVTTVAVDPALQGGAIGTRLLLALARAAVARGATALTLEVRASNEVAHRLYRRFGFAAAGVRKGYYGDNGEDAVVMWANDIDHIAFTERLDAIERGLAARGLRTAADQEGQA